MKTVLIILISWCLMFAPLISQEVASDSTKTEQISEEEEFLQDIADKAYEKDKKRAKIERNVLLAAVVYLLIDKYLQKKEKG